MENALGFLDGAAKSEAGATGHYSSLAGGRTYKVSPSTMKERGPQCRINQREREWDLSHREVCDRRGRDRALPAF